jgi:hypothetical protein
MSEPVLLLIAYYFPPDNEIGGARPFRLYKYLKRLGYQCHVLTAAGVEGKGIAPDVQGIPDPLKLHPRRGLAWQVERVSFKLLLRGMYFLGWSQAVAQAGRTFLAQREADQVTILSSSPPLGTHLAAWRLAREFKRPWIADFRDPIYRLSSDRAWLENSFAPALERRVLKNASLVLANTDAMRDSWIARFPDLEEKIQVLWNGFDPEDVILPTSLPGRDCKVWSHAGELYGGRDMRPLLYALERLIKSERLRPGSVKIRQVGIAEPECLPPETFLEDARKQGWLELAEPVPAAEARRLALDSDGLLLIQPQTAVQVPGKLFEYLRLGRPILAYVARNSPAEHILERAGVPYKCFYPDTTPEEIETRLMEFWNLLQPHPFAPNKWFESTFEATRQAEALDRAIRSISSS